MAQKPKAGSPKSGKAKSQSERFIETARELGVDETGKEFERAMGRIARAAKPGAKKAGS
jgi:hypothetical protein